MAKERRDMPRYSERLTGDGLAGRYLGPKGGLREIELDPERQGLKIKIGPYGAVLARKGKSMVMEIDDAVGEVRQIVDANGQFATLVLVGKGEYGLRRQMANLDPRLVFDDRYIPSLGDEVVRIVEQFEVLGDPSMLLLAGARNRDGRVSYKLGGVGLVGSYNRQIIPRAEIEMAVCELPSKAPTKNDKLLEEWGGGDISLLMSSLNGLGVNNFRRDGQKMSFVVGDAGLLETGIGGIVRQRMVGGELKLRSCAPEILDRRIVDVASLRDQTFITYRVDDWCGKWVATIRVTRTRGHYVVEINETGGTGRDQVVTDKKTPMSEVLMRRMGMEMQGMGMERGISM